jgi:predicted ribosome quality control (RQC) complex YloA/Tae2 family protein
MKFQILSQVVEELSRLLTGARLERVYQGAETEFYCIFHIHKKNFVLLFSPDRRMPRLHLVSAKPPARTSPHPFVLYLRSHLVGSRVASIGLLNQDRVVEIRFAKPGAEYRLVFELIGTSVNFILIDSLSKILLMYYQIPLSGGSVRPLMPGLQYILPEKKPMRSFTKAVSDVFSQSENGAAISPNKEAETFYQQQHQQRERASIRAVLLSIIHKALSRTDRRIIALSQDLDSADRAEEYRQAGDLVLANLGRLRTGMELVELSGYDGNTVSVQLDPKLSPARNADRYFKKYKKAKVGHSIIIQRLQLAEAETLLLKALRARLNDGDDEGDLSSIRSALVAGGYIKAKGKEKAPVGPAPPGYRTIMFHGWEILVGKGAVGNDYITTKIARTDDLWLHAEGMPGSHVLVKNPGKVEIPANVLLKAAALAAYYSKGKKAGKVSVTYTRAGRVKKPKGAKAGLVTLTERKSIMVRPEEP